MAKKKKATRKKKAAKSAEPSQDGAVTPAAPTGGVLEAQQVIVPDALPIMALRETVVFPGSIVPLQVGRPRSLKMLDAALPNSKVIGLIAQRDAEVEDPAPDDLYDVGCACVVLKLVRQNEDSVTILVHGLRRFRATQFTQNDPYLIVKTDKLEDQQRMDKKLEALFRTLRETATELIDASPNIPDEVKQVIADLATPGQLADFLAANLDVGVDEKQDLLEETNVAKRVRAVLQTISRQVEIARLQQKIHADVQSTITDVQRKAYLREQLKAIQKELGEDGDGAEAQVEALREKLEAADPPEAVMTEVERELRRLSQMHPASPEHSVITTYIETVAELPWNTLSDEAIDLDHAQSVLDRDHFDLEKVKKRLIEYLAVRKLNPKRRGPILCLVGPPGVGKTSLGHSIADALGREFVRMSLGGIRDEAEIRGHRRTYIGSMPGRIIQEMRRAGTRNPVMMLDELDKLGSDFRGDPASALLEVLDPRQNFAFIDRYLDVPFDLSQVIFIATANYMEPVPPALRDRMEVIEIAGYTDADKLEIAMRYLVPRQMRECGLKKKDCSFTVAALRKIIDAYTREAGVRSLERQIGAVCRSIAADVAAERVDGKVKVDEAVVAKALGPEQHVRELAKRTAMPGVATGLAYTPTGGEILFIEAARYEGKGNLQLTGQLGDVMKESASTALSLVRSRAESLEVDPAKFKDADLHLHVPAGAVPKDGPSAGIAMFTAIASLLLGKPARHDIAMTGEITLRGLVLPIGGIKEKTLAALRAGIKTVILPKGNEKDMPEVTDEVRKKVKFKFVENVDEVLKIALT